MNRLSLLFTLDTNVLIEGFEFGALRALRELRNDGWIQLNRTDTLDLELLGKEDAAVRAQRLRASSEFPELLGPAIYEHSRWDHAVWPTEDDVDRLTRVWRVMFPKLEWDDARDQHKRDAMHVATAIRYGTNAFITRNRRGLLTRARAVNQAFNGFWIWTPEKALEFALRMRRRAEIRGVGA